MKKLFYLAVILLTSAFTIVIFSCSKEKITLPEATDEISIDNSSARIGNWGSVTGLILPLQTQVGIRIFNDKFYSKDFYYTKDGHFRFDKIPPGVYMLTISYYRTPGYPVTEIPIPGSEGQLSEYVIYDVKVVTGMLMDIGVIKLQ